MHEVGSSFQAYGKPCLWLFLKGLQAFLSPKSLLMALPPLWLGCSPIKSWLRWYKGGTRSRSSLMRWDFLMKLLRCWLNPSCRRMQLWGLSAPWGKSLFSLGIMCSVIRPFHPHRFITNSYIWKLYLMGLSSSMTSLMGDLLSKLDLSLLCNR